MEQPKHNGTAKKEMALQWERLEQTVEVFQNADVLDLARLMEDARFLSCQTYPFAREVGEMKRHFHLAHVERRFKFVELVKKYRGEGMRISEAERLAETDPEFQRVFRDEYELEARYEKGKLFFQAISHVLNRMQQEIAELREEKRSIGSQGQT